MVIAAIIVFQLIDAGFFNIISSYMKGLPLPGYLPSEGLPVIAAWFASNVVHTPLQAGCWQMEY
jgi:hypothetical protein